MNTLTQLKRISLAALVIVCGIVSQSLAQTKAENINYAAFLVFGRFATYGENQYWAKQNPTFAQLVAYNKTALKNSPAEKQATIQRAFMDSFGWGPSAGEVNTISGQGMDYADIMTFNKNSTLWPAPDKRALVIKQSYYKVFNRTATQAEVNYWLQQPVYSFVQLIAFHSSWKVRSAQTSTITAIQPGLNANGIQTASLTSGGASNLVAAGGGNLVAAGGGNLVAAGGGNLVAAGGGR